MDDHPVLRLGLRKAFERHRDLVVAWDMGDATGLTETVMAHPVDVVLMDVHLRSGPDGLTATRALRSAQPDVRVVVLSADLDLESAAAARRAGAVGYLAKDMDIQEMVEAVKGFAAPAARLATLPPDTRLVARADRAGWSAIRALTVREMQVLDELRAGQTNRQIASHLGVSVTTVNKHVQHVLKKLNVNNRGQAVARVTGEGRIRSDRSRPPVRVG